MPRLILTKGVQVLEIDITNRNSIHIPPYGPIFCLPDILLSVSSLTSLKLCNCEWPSSLMVIGMRFKSLKLLSLEYLLLDEEVIKILTTSCPLLEELTVRYCSGFKRFCIYGLKNHQIVQFFYEHGVERIDIAAQNLSFLLLSSSHEKNVTLPCVNVASCKKLTTLHYSGNPFPASKGFTDLSSHFSFLENLFLDLPDERNSLKLSSHSLRTFVLRSLALHSISCHNKVDNSLLLSLFTSEKILKQEDEDRINIRIEMSWSSKGKKQFCDIIHCLQHYPVI
ncbi:F-box domain containing protein [Tanacetum coccineum]